MLLHILLRTKLLLRLVSPAAMLGAVLAAAPTTNTTPVVAERLSAADANVFFGYYDLPAVDAPTGRHLAHRVPFRDRLPVAGDEAELGVINLDVERVFRPFARTGAWNFQQGALLQWLGDGTGRVFYNDVQPEGRGYRGVLHDLATGERTFTDRALANLSRDGRWGLGVDFDRMHDFRPGYGYAAQDDPREGVPHPADDGIWVCNLRTGASRLVLSLAALHERVRALSPLMEQKLLVNHLTFNPSASRLVFLLRNFPAPGPRLARISHQVVDDAKRMSSAEAAMRAREAKPRPRGEAEEGNRAAARQRGFSNAPIPISPSPGAVLPEPGFRIHHPSGEKSGLKGQPAWITAVFTAARDGSDLRLLVPPGYASHYHWRDDSTIVFHCDGPDGPQLYEITDATPPRFAALDREFFKRDGHCSYSPDGRWLLYDSYPDAAGKRHLFLYDLRECRGRELGAFAALPVSVTDIRCDLHPRWLPDGRISFDSTHEGFRGLYLIDPKR